LNIFSQPQSYRQFVSNQLRTVVRTFNSNYQRKLEFLAWTSFS